MNNLRGRVRIEPRSAVPEADALTTWPTRRKRTGTQASLTLDRHNDHSILTATAKAHIDSSIRNLEDRTTDSRQDGHKANGTKDQNRNRWSAPLTSCLSGPPLLVNLRLEMAMLVGWALNTDN